MEKFYLDNKNYTQTAHELETKTKMFLHFFSWSSSARSSASHLKSWLKTQEKGSGPFGLPFVFQCIIINQIC